MVLTNLESRSNLLNATTFFLIQIDFARHAGVAESETTLNDFKHEEDFNIGTYATNLHCH